MPHLKENFDAIRCLQTDTERENIDLIDKLEYIGKFAFEIGRWGEAAAMQKEVLEKRQRIFGDEHLDTIKAMHNLVLTLSNQGQF